MQGGLSGARESRGGARLEGEGLSAGAGEWGGDRPNGVYEVRMRARAREQLAFVHLGQQLEHRGSGCPLLWGERLHERWMESDPRSCQRSGSKQYQSVQISLQQAGLRAVHHTAAL